jgi:hypothetical protein
MNEDEGGCCPNIVCLKHLSEYIKTLSWQSSTRKIANVQQAIRYGDFGIHYMLTKERSKLLTMTH